MVCILGITTSTARGGAAVLVDGRVAGARVYDDVRGHAERLFAAIDGALADAGVDRRALEAIACDVGPGSFTGVRVGVASAKGIALGLGVPEVPVGSLTAMAWAAFRDGTAAADDLVFAAISTKGPPREGAPPSTAPAEIIVALLDREGRELVSPRIVPATLDVVEALLAEALPPGVRGVRWVGAFPGRGDDAHPTAAAVAALAAARLERGERAGPLEAIYLRPAVLPSR